jgi:signal transduction histidine kinase
MGVAAIDVPLYEFQRLFESYRFGSGGYVFVIDQNGHVLTHPEFRPLVS